MVLNIETKQNTLLSMKSVITYISKMVLFVFMFDILAYDFGQFMRLSVIVYRFSAPFKHYTQFLLASLIILAQGKKKLILF